MTTKQALLFRTGGAVKPYRPKTKLSINDGRPITEWQHKLESIAERDKFFVRVCEQRNIPIPQREYLFAKGKKYRFDFAWVEQKIALEVQGGYESKERQGHSRKRQAASDFKKVAAANLLGWRVFYCMPSDMFTARVEKMLLMALGVIPVDIKDIC